MHIILASCTSPVSIFVLLHVTGMFILAMVRIISDATARNTNLAVLSAEYLLLEEMERGMTYNIKDCLNALAIFPNCKLIHEYKLEASYLGDENRKKPLNYYTMN